MNEAISILIVDDNPADRNLVKRNLMKEFTNVSIAEADSRESLVSRLDEFPCDLVITDYDLQGINGLEIIDLVKERNQKILIIMLTGTGTEEIAIEAMKRGIADYVIKTVSHIKRLPITIKQVMERAVENSYRNEMEEALRQSEARYRTLVENLPICIHELDLEGRFISMNRYGLGMIQKNSLDEIIGAPYLDFVVSEDREQIEKLFGQAIKGQTILFEFRVEVKNQIRFFSSSFVPLSSTDGKIHKIIGVSEDITDRITLQNQLKGSIEEEKSARQKLQVSTDQIIQILERITNGFVALDTNWRYTYVNKAAGEILKRRPEGLIGKNIWEEFPEGVGKPFYYAYRQAMATQKTVMLEEFYTPWKRWFKNHIYPTKDGLSIFFDDITDRKKTEEELLKSQKLESISTLAGGIAHDFNNLLTGIIGNISLVKKKMDPADNFFRQLSRAEKASEQAQNLTQQLLTFSSGGLPIKKATSITRLVNETVEFTLSGSGSIHELSFPKYIWPVEIDEGQIRQVIQNLVINADQSMPTGGKIEIEGENIVVNSKHGLPLKNGDYVKLFVRDCGPGISAESISKIFDPFFTTKQRGSGLGLAVAYSIIKNHNGHVTVDSELAKGSTFTVYLPRSKNPISTVIDKKELPTSHAGKVLIMDDDEFIRDFAGEALKEVGYTVQFARNGTEAVKMYRTAFQQGESFDAIIVDLTIPGGMGGKETIVKLLKIDAKVKAIVSSGYSNDPIMGNYQDFGFKEAIAKPYKFNKLVWKLHRLLHAKKDR